MKNFDINKVRLEDFCKKHKIRELSLFGSALRDDFNDKSDIDLLYVFSDDSSCGLFDVVRIKDELEELFGRRVDLVSKDAIEKSRNIIRRESILENSRIIYAA